MSTADETELTRPFRIDSTFIGALSNVYVFSPISANFSIFREDFDFSEIESKTIAKASSTKTNAILSMIHALITYIYSYLTCVLKKAAPTSQKNFMGRNRWFNVAYGN
ncbi:MAG TPA: hypothetical protein VIM59_13380 [Cellvibrio sp.]